MILSYPTHFNMSLPNFNRKFYAQSSQNKIKEILTKASNGYCMYCGNLIEINGKNSGQLEHSIEKVQFGENINYLTHCKYNLSIACSTCNTSFKKNVKNIKVNKNYTCSKKCTHMCEEYLKNSQEYFYYNKIITMPSGVINIHSNQTLNIEYNLLNMSFQPASKPYTQEDILFIENHIDRFKLNSEEYMPVDILKVCEYVVENNKLPHLKTYNNVIADIFINYLNENVCLQNLGKVCKLIIIMNSI